MSGYTAFHCTVIGQRYIEKEKPCEDYSLSCNDDDIHIAVVADGHGDPRCFRSNVGSRKACEITLEQLKRFAHALQQEDVERQLFTRFGARKLTDNLFRSIVTEWQHAVLADIAENPMTEEERASVDSAAAAVYQEGRELVHIYGTTLIAMLMTERYLLVLHQGDGRCVVMHHDGTVDQPVPWDPRCEGRNTSSLCDNDVLASWRYHLIDLEKDPIAACYAVSDGIEDSFETMEELNAFLCHHAGEYVSKGADAYLAELPAQFAALTKNGSRDDTSMGCIIDTDKVSEFASQYQLSYDYCVSKAENRHALDRIKSMKRKTRFLKDAVDNAQAAYDQVLADEEADRQEMNGLQRMILALTRKMDTHKDSEKTAERELIIARAEYNDYMALREEYVERAKEAKKKMDEAKKQIDQLNADHAADAVPDAAREEFVYTQPLGTDDESWAEASAEEKLSPEPNASDTDGPMESPAGAEAAPESDASDPDKDTEPKEQQVDYGK